MTGPRYKSINPEWIEGIEGTAPIGGVFIGSDDPLPIGSFVEFRFTVPGKKGVFHAKGVVNWSNNQHRPDQPQGMRLLMSTLAVDRDAMGSGTAASSLGDLADTENAAKLDDIVSESETSTPSAKSGENQKAKATKESGQKLPACKMPEQESIHSCLSGIIGECEITKKEGSRLTIDGKTIISSYKHATGELGAIIIADMEFCGYAGAALAMVPAEGVRDNIARAKLSENVIENAREIFNISASLFNDAKSPRQVLSDVHWPSNDTVTDEIRELHENHTKRANFEVEIENYGKGQLSFFTR